MEGTGDFEYIPSSEEGVSGLSEDEFSSTDSFAEKLEARWSDERRLLGRLFETQEAWELMKVIQAFNDEGVSFISDETILEMVQGGKMSLIDLLLIFSECGSLPPWRSP